MENIWLIQQVHFSFKIFLQVNTCLKQKYQQCSNKKMIKITQRIGKMKWKHSIVKFLFYTQVKYTQCKSYLKVDCDKLKILIVNPRQPLK